MTYTHDADVGRSVTRLLSCELREVGDWERGETICEATAPLAPHVVDEHGALLTGALLTLCDNVGGLCGGLASLPDGWVVSTNLAARVIAPVTTGPITRCAAPSCEKADHAVVTDVTVHDSDGTLRGGPC